MAGKGSAPRRDRKGVQKKKYDANWDRIFKGNKKTDIPAKAQFHENGVSYEPDRS